MSLPFRFTALAAVALAFNASGVSADESLAPVLVTASRFDDTDPRIPANVSVLTRQDIRALPANNLPDALKSVAGIETRPLYGLMGMDASVDMRGFGSTATSNTLILVDGMRVNPVDMGSIIWSAIPLESVERIEVIRGSGSVLYGDGATGGVVNIVTNKSAKSRASINASLGSRNYRGVGAELAVANEQAYLSAFVQQASGDGYRRNADQNQTTLSGRGGWFLDRGELFVDYAVYDESAELPGNRLSAEYHNDPRGTRTPHDRQTRDGYRLRPGVRYQLSDRLEFEAEAGVEHQNLRSRYVSTSYTSNRDRDTVSLTPRLRWRHGLGGLDSETVAGIDYYDSDVKAANTGWANQGAAQTSTALYVQNVTRLLEPLSLTVGARKQRVRQSAEQDAYPLYGLPAMSGSETRSRNAYDLGLTYRQGAWRVYGKTGTTFRFANTDELFGSDPFGTPVFAGNLRPQHGTIREIGAEVKGAAASVRGSVYRLDLSDEIGYDGALFANTNFDRTRRNGLEIEASWQVLQSLLLKAGYAHIDAHFREGRYEGKTLPLVPRHQGSLQAIWNAGAAGQYAALVRYTGDRRYGSDFANTQGMLDGYATVDLSASWNLKPWQVSARLLNATDRKYSPFAGYSAFRNDTYYYPADGRSFLVTARHQF